MLESIEKIKEFIDSTASLSGLGTIDSSILLKFDAFLFLSPFSTTALIFFIYAIASHALTIASNENTTSLPHESIKKLDNGLSAAISGCLIAFDCAYNNKRFSSCYEMVIVITDSDSCRKHGSRKRSHCFQHRTKVHLTIHE